MTKEHLHQKCRRSVSLLGMILLCLFWMSRRIEEDTCVDLGQLVSPNEKCSKYCKFAFILTHNASSTSAKFVARDTRYLINVQLYWGFHSKGILSLDIACHVRQTLYWCAEATTRPFQIKEFVYTQRKIFYYEIGT